VTKQCNSLTRSNTVVLEKPIDVQTIKIFLVFYVNRRLISVFILLATEPQLEPGNILTFFSILILSSTLLVLPSGVFLPVFQLTAASAVVDLT
jgi:hypothetical protein